MLCFSFHFHLVLQFIVAVSIFQSLLSRFGTLQVIPNAGGSNQVAVALVKISFVKINGGGKTGCFLVG